MLEPELEDLEEPVVRLEPVDEPALLAGTEPQRCRVSGVKAAAIADVTLRVQTSAIRASRAGVLMVWSLVLFAVGFGLYGLLRMVNSEDYWRGKQMDHPVYYPEGKCPKCGE